MADETCMTSGAILPKLFVFSIPLILTAILQQLYSMSDAVIVKWLLGLEGFSAIGLTGALLWFSESMLLGLTQGFGVVFANTYGKGGALTPVRRAATRAALVVAGIMVAPALLFRAPLMRLTQTPESLMTDATRYFVTMQAFLLAAALFNTAAAELRAVGDSRTPFIAMIVSNLSNIVLDILFVKGFGLGIIGAGLATAVCQFLAWCVCLRRLCACTKDDDAGCADWRPLLRMGLPSMVRNGVISGGGVFLQSVINGFGVAVIAGVAAAKKYFSLIQIGSSALEGAAATFVGQNHGAGKPKRIRTGMRVLCGLGLMTSVLIGGAVILAAPALIGLILGTGNAEALAHGIAALRWASAFLPALYLLCIVRAGLQSMGYAGISMGSGFIELGARVLTALILPAWVGSTTAYVMELPGWVAAAVFLGACYIWKRPRGEDV